MSFGVFDSQSVIIYDFRKNILGFSDVKNKGIRLWLLFPVCIDLFVFLELIVLILTDFLFFFKVFVLKMDKKIPCQFETGRVNTIYPSPDILAFLSCLCQIARRKQSTPHIAFPSDHNIQYEKHTKQLTYV